MNSILIGYDLDSPGQDYADLITAIKSLGLWWHCLDSTFIVKTKISCTEIRSFLEIHIGSNDKLLVAKLSGEVSWVGFSDECSQWLKDNV